MPVVYFCSTYTQKMNYRHRLFLLAPLLFLFACATVPKRITHYQTSYTAIDTALAKDVQLEAMLLSYRTGMDTQMNVVVGYTTVPLSKAQPECTAGNFMADAQLAVAQRTDSGVKISVLNYGGIRLPYISPGALTRGKLYELMPFDNKLAIMELSGKTLHIFCDHIAAYGGWPVAGLRFQIKDKKATDIFTGDNPIDEQKIYKVAVPDYVATGGDNCSFLVDCKRTMVNIFIRDMLIDYVAALHKNGQSLNTSLEKRISYAQ